MLQQKNAVIYGAGGSLGGAVAKALANAGATLFLTGRNAGPLEKIAGEIRAAGGKAEVTLVDAMDEDAVQRHLEDMVQRAGLVDISFNATGIDVVQNIPLTTMSTKDFLDPITHMMQTRFITAIAAGRVMMNQGSGVILSLTATPGGIGYPYTGGFAPACVAIETLAQNLASELGAYGVRVVNMRSGGSPDSRVFKEAMAQAPEEMEVILTKMKADTMLKRMPPMADIANVAVFLSSDMAAGITGVTVDVTCGTTAALNYRVAVSTDSRAGQKLAS
ncbi:SDR family NAD(P)-dependent oxidoreductase [Niastella populi]|uniref:Short-chain dehydrogenase n=1 Tax=Niastella populi TaxID=550983 RepID=A0A1V9F7Z2_9BACT|nr:SDR family oxidoreductase [Niastella populi]OQP54392.1 short-chain dehydrogenase [Niastella populi]